MTTSVEKARGDHAETPANGALPAGAGDQGAGASRRVASALGGFGERYSLLLLTGGVIVFFSLYGPTSDTFLTRQNFEVTVANQAVLAIIALGLLIPLICGEFDLSVAAVAGLSAIYVAAALSSGVAIPVAILIGLAIGAVVGLVNAFLVARLRLDAVIATLGTATIVGGIVMHKTGGKSIVSNIPQSFTDFGTGTLWVLPSAAVVLLVVAAVTWFVLEQTSAGRQIYALGSNPVAARLVGIRTQGVMAGTFVLAGLLSGLAGALYVARSGGADPRSGANFLLPAFAAAFLSAATVKPGKYNVGGLIIAVFFLAALNSGLNLAGAAPYVNDYVNGGALIAGVALAAVLHRRRMRG